MLQQVLQQILQRVPGLLVIALIPFTLLAPSYCPVFFAGYYSFLNLVLLYTSIRTAAGSCIAWIMSVRHSKTDWDSYSSGFVANARYSGLLSSDTMGTHHEITHWIIIPNYKEEINNLRDSLAVLASHDEAGGSYNICLAMEASEEFASDKAKALTREFTRSFQKIIYTVHPSNMPNEMRGKSSNLAWAARYLAGIIPASSSSTTLLTILDADTCLASDYFKSISVKYSGTPFSRRNLQLYTPFSIFDRNSSSVPALVRVLDIAWSAAQLAYLMPGYPFTPALSAYSIPFELAREIGFWDCHWAAMAEDMHMTFKIIVATRGRVQVQQIYSPASQCNIVGRTNSAWSGVKAKTVQLKRHNWGGSLEFSGVFSVLLVKLLGSKTSTPTLSDDFLYSGETLSVWEKTRAWFGGFIGFFFAIYHLLEITVWSGHVLVVNVLAAVFVPGFGPLFLKPISVAWWGVLNIDGPSGEVVADVILGLKAWVPYVQLCVLPCMILAAIGYEGTFSWCSKGRWVQDATREVLGKRSSLVSRDRKWFHMFEWILYPVVAIFFAAVMIYVGLMQVIWGRLDYVVAAKPVAGPATSTELAVTSLESADVEVLEVVSKDSAVDLLGFKTAH